MLRLDEIRMQLRELEKKRAALEGELIQAEKEKQYKAYLSKLVAVDIAQGLSEEMPLPKKRQVLQWLESDEQEGHSITIKDWVVATIGKRDGRIETEELRAQFKEKFGPGRLASLRQYLARRPLGLVRKEGEKLKLTKKGKSEFRKLKSNK